MNEFKNHFNEINQDVDESKVSNNSMPTTSAAEVLDICKDVVSIKKHNRTYDKLLEIYTAHIERTLVLKSDLKKDFYELCKGILIYLILAYIGIGVIMFTCHLHGIIISDEKFKIFFGSTFATFLTSFISIPIIIAKYLFYPEEEKRATEIVKNMQLHDKVIRKILFKNKTK